MKAQIKLMKLALKRDDSIPVGQTAELHVDCPCGHPIRVLGTANTCSWCGLTVDSRGWIIEKPLTEAI